MPCSSTSVEGWGGVEPRLAGRPADKTLTSTSWVAESLPKSAASTLQTPVPPCSVWKVSENSYAGMPWWVFCVCLLQGRACYNIAHSQRVEHSAKRVVSWGSLTPRAGFYLSPDWSWWSAWSSMWRKLFCMHNTGDFTSAASTFNCKVFCFESELIDCVSWLLFSEHVVHSFIMQTPAFGLRFFT